LFELKGPAVARSIGRQRLTEATAAPPPILGHRLLARHFSRKTPTLVLKKPEDNQSKKVSKLFASWLVGHRQQKASIVGVVGS
jgi:hypothetical protein